MKTSTVYIEGREYRVDAAENMLHACLSLGFDLPRAIGNVVLVGLVGAGLVAYGIFCGARTRYARLDRPMRRSSRVA